MANERGGDTVAGGTGVLTTNDVYVAEKIKAYNVAIEALLNHERADGDPTGLARRLRGALARKLDKEIQKWCDALPPNDGTE